jgi:NAD(P)-dependent dehydrogenase (short-subunit alcohol dehydrogenase family)
VHSKHTVFANVHSAVHTHTHTLLRCGGRVLSCRMVSEVVSGLGRLDIAVNNAGACATQQHDAVCVRAHALRGPGSV